MTPVSRLLTHISALLVLLCLSTALRADDKGIGWGWGAFAITGQVADGVTTIGQKELNPVTRPVAGHPALLLAFKASFGAGIAWLGDWLGHRGHPRAGKALCSLAGAAGWGMAAHNVMQGRR